MKMKERQWNSKVQAMPRIPRSQTENGYVDSLIKILKAVENKRSNNDILEFEGSKSSNKLSHYCIRLRPIGIVEKNNNDWCITEEFKNWNEKNIKEVLPILLNYKIKYISEMLDYIREPKKINDILAHAKENYNMTWKESSQIYDRLHWFMDLGLVKHINYKQNYTLTKSGERFITNYPPIDSAQILNFTYDQTEKEVDIEIPDFLYYTYQYDWSNNRKNNIGYVPGGVENIPETISDILNLSIDYADFNTIYKYLKSTYNISEKSVGAFTTYLTHLNVLERIKDKVYKTTTLGKDILNYKNINLSLIFLLHKQYNYIFEILYVIKDESMNIQDLLTLAKTKFNIQINSKEQIRKRINYLKNAYLIIDDIGKTYRLTKRGENLCSKLNSYYEDSYKKKDNNVSSTSYNNEYNLDKLLYELRTRSEDSNNPRRFEEILQLAFKELGFDSKLLAKSGTTDILLTAPTVPEFSYRVNVDAKTNKNGKITENLIDFETLKEHKEKHKAKYVVVVGKSFVGTRLIKRAENNGIALIDIDTLEILLKNNRKFPLRALEYLPIFEQSGIVNLKVLDKIYGNMNRQKYIFKIIIEILKENSDDPYTNGIMSEDIIYFIVKQKSNFKNDPVSMKEIKDMLSLLSNPLIDCVGKKKEGYYAKGSLNDAALKFRFYYDVSTK